MLGGMIIQYLILMISLYPSICDTTAAKVLNFLLDRGVIVNACSSSKA